MHNPISYKNKKYNISPTNSNNNNNTLKISHNNPSTKSTPLISKSINSINKINLNLKKYKNYKSKYKKLSSNHPKPSIIKDKTAKKHNSISLKLSKYKKSILTTKQIMR